MNDTIQDVDYQSVDEPNKTIRGKRLYYSTSQVSSILGETDSKIRYYTSVFDEILHIEISNKQRRYSEQDIEKLKFIIELKNEGMTLKQISEYCSEVSFEENEGIQIKETNPLSIKTLAKALMEEQHKQMLEFKQEVIDAVSLQLSSQIDIIKSNNENLKDKIVEQVALTVDNVIDDKLNSVVENQNELKELHQQNQEELKDFVAITIQNEVKTNLEEQLTSPIADIKLTMEQQTNKYILEKEEIIHKHMEERKHYQKLLEDIQSQNKNKSLWQRILNK